MIGELVAAWLRPRVYAWRGRRTLPEDVVRRDDGTLWTVPQWDLVRDYGECMEGFWSGKSPWIFELIRRKPDGNWLRMGIRWKTYSPDGWDVLVKEGQIIRGQEYLA